MLRSPLTLALVLLALAAACRAAPPRPRPDLEEAFHHDPGGFRGADGAYGLRLSPTSVLWLFGDTVVAPPGEAGRNGARMVNNSLALQVGAAPLRFYWRRSPAGQPRSVFEPATPGRYYWPFDGGLTPGGELAVFLMEIESTGEGGLMGFRQVGSALATIDAPRRSPRSWSPEVVPVPFGRSGTHQRFWGAAVLVEGPWMFVYGYDEVVVPGKPDKRLVVARAPAASPGNFSAWRFWDGEGWSPDEAAAARSGFSVSAEFSVHRGPSGAVQLVTSDGTGQSGAVYRVMAPGPAGPWGAAEPLFTCPDLEEVPGAMCYSAKAQPQLAAPPGRLLVSYCTNHSDFWTMLASPRLYYPRLVEVDAGGR